MSMFLFVHVHISTYLNKSMHKCISLHAFRYMCKWLYVHMILCKYECYYTYVYIYICRYIYTYMYVCMYVCMYACMYVCMYVHS